MDKKLNKLEESCKTCAHVNVCSSYEKIEAVILKKPTGYNFRHKESLKVYRALADICKDYKKQKEVIYEEPLFK